MASSFSLMWRLSRASRSGSGSGSPRFAAPLKVNPDVLEAESVFLVQQLVELNDEESPFFLSFRNA